MLIHPVFKISSNTRVKLTSTVTDINVPRLVHIQHLFNHKDRAGLPSLRSGQAHRGSRLDRKAKIEKGADVGPFSILAPRGNIPKRAFMGWIAAEYGARG